jgi:hypothetical protein
MARRKREKILKCNQTFGVPPTEQTLNKGDIRTRDRCRCSLPPPHPHLILSCIQIRRLRMKSAYPPADFYIPDQSWAPEAMKR